VDIIGTRGNCPSDIVAPTASPISFLITNHVPSQSLGAFMFRSKTTGEPIFVRKSCGGSPGESNELKNSVG